MSKKYRILVTLSTIFLIIILLNSHYTVNADTGPKPSITIHLKNMNTNNYIIDLFEYAENKNDYYPNGNFLVSKSISKSEHTNEDEIREKNGILVNFSKISDFRNITIEQAEKLYDMDYNGWISSCMRNSILWGGCAGNAEHEHYFNYFGVPSTYKVVIINNDTGETKITDIIQSKNYNSDITLDVNTMEVSQSKLAFIKSINIFLLTSLAIPLILTLAIEIIIALIMKIKNIKTIFITNLMTNLVLQLVMMYTPFIYILTFAIMEILVIAVEYLIYKKYFNDIPTNKIFIYTLISNIISSLLTFII